MLTYFFFQVSIYNIGHYDAFVIYAHALNETLTANEDPRDGLNIINRIWNRTFLGRTDVYGLHT